MYNVKISLIQIKILGSFGKKNKMELPISILIGLFSSILIGLSSSIQIILTKFTQ